MIGANWVFTKMIQTECLAISVIARDFTEGSPQHLFFILIASREPFFMGACELPNWLHRASR
jgi:hypothetical protein